MSVDELRIALVEAQAGVAHFRVKFARHTIISNKHRRSSARWQHATNAARIERDNIIALRRFSLVK
jgi:hypothetical protein